MKRNSCLFITVLVISILTIGGLVTSCIDAVRGNGNVVTEDRPVKEFDALRVSGSFEVIIEQGNEESLRIEADENLMEIIETDVRSGTLIIHTEENVIRAESLKAYITFIDLYDIEISGAVELDCIGDLAFEDLFIEASGATEIDLDLNTELLEIGLSGSSEIDLSGTASEMTIDASGAAELFAEDLELKTCYLSISGAGSAVVNVSDLLDIDISGAASVKYKGEPRISQRVSGAAKVRRID